MNSSSSGDQKHILLVSPYWRERHRWMVSSVKLAELWQRLGYRVTVVCMGKKTETVHPSETLTIHTVKDVFLPDPWNYGIAPGFSRTVMRVWRQEKPDVIVVNKVLFWSSLSIFSLRRAGARVILLTDTLVGFTWWPRSILARVGAWIYARTLGWLVLRSAHQVVFFHPQPQQLLRRLDIARKTQVIPTGIDPVPYARERTAANDVRIAYVGRLESVKGVGDLLAAAGDVLEQFPSVRVDIVGWHKDDHPLVKQYASDRIHFLGLRDDIADVLANVDIFVLPSYSEGLSNALMEAMASGCACIASRTGGNAYLIEDNVSGLLFPPGNRTAIAHHLRTLIRNPALRTRLGDGARARIHAMFSWEIVGRHYERLFHDHAVS